ncbi:hypothetical protein N8I77_010522 [Diaporthe amygdali]|uniref:F-box domain-containing protein n=1 Tax=Phomopsis amygdali TaxID=1214568 RepID=A0AAD9VZH0_PHOAM|nr:hypothetical protein N8I77_010522 [Diaporthe amygdali]
MELPLTDIDSAIITSMERMISEVRKENEELRLKLARLKDNKPHTRTIQELPVEILLMIAGHLEDTDELRAFMQTSQKLHCVWHENKVQFITRMLGMVPDVLEEAASASRFLTTQMDDGSFWEMDSNYWVVDGNIGVPLFPAHICIATKGALSFVGNKNPCQPNSCTFQDAMRLERTHPFVRRLADIYIEQCAASNPALSATLSSRPVTSQERARIERAFYRFETFRRAFAPFEGHGHCQIPDSFTDDWLQNPIPYLVQDFKESFDAVELIQLHCIYGFLKRLVTPAINDLIWHSCHLSEMNLVEDWATDHRVAPLIFRGLQFVYEMWAAFRNRRMSVLSCCIRIMGPLSFQPYLGAMYDTAFYDVLYAELHTKHNASVQDIKSRIAIHDRDTSPRDACLAVASSIQAMGQQDLVTLREEMDSVAPHRRWGFVMWDHSRLELMGFFKQQHDAPPGSGIGPAKYILSSTAFTLGQHRLANLPYFDRQPWWERAPGPFPHGPRLYDTWYPLAMPQNLDVVEQVDQE